MLAPAPLVAGRHLRGVRRDVGHAGLPDHAAGGEQIVTNGQAIYFIIAIALIMLCLYIAGEGAAERRLHAEAVKLGYAEWIVDPATGTTTWQWKPPVVEKP